MSYNDFKKIWGDLENLYHPKIQSPELAAAAFKCGNFNKLITPEHIKALEAFAFGASNYYSYFKYDFCVTCKKHIDITYGHIHCPKCNNIEYNIKLKDCNACTACCLKERHACAGCFSHSVTLHSRCNYGRTCGCCYCLPKIKYGTPWIVKSKEDTKVFKNTRLVGVEWEFNQANNTEKAILTWTKTWRSAIHEDASCGREAVTAPIAGDYISKCLTDLGIAFKTADVEVDKDCSVHVHVDIRDFTWDNVLQLMSVYARFEPLLYLLGGQARINNTYCSPIGAKYKKVLDKKLNAKDQQAALLSIIYDIPSKDEAIRHHKIKNKDKKDEGRYRGMNLIPWVIGKPRRAKDSTVEFRIHKDTLDTERIISWTQLLATLVEYSSKSTDKKLKNLPESDLKALIKIAPGSKAFILQRIKDWRQATCLNKTKTKRRITRKIFISPGGKFDLKKK